MPKKLGRKPDRLSLTGEWGDAVAKAVAKPRPVTGWPKRKTAKKRAKKKRGS